MQVSTNALYDIQIKRIHEYKRQHLNLFSIIHRYLEIKNMSPQERKKVSSKVGSHLPLLMSPCWSYPGIMVAAGQGAPHAADCWVSICLSKDASLRSVPRCSADTTQQASAGVPA